MLSRKSCIVTMATRLLDPACRYPACGCASLEDLRRPLSPATRALSRYSRDDLIARAAACPVPGARNQGRDPRIGALPRLPHPAHPGSIAPPQLRPGAHGRCVTSPLWARGGTRASPAPGNAA